LNPKQGKTKISFFFKIRFSTCSLELLFTKEDRNKVYLLKTTESVLDLTKFLKKRCLKKAKKSVKKLSV
jgi:hypothetical protein